MCEILWEFCIFHVDANGGEMCNCRPKAPIEGLECQIARKTAKEPSVGISLAFWVPSEGFLKASSKPVKGLVKAC